MGGQHFIQLEVACTQTWLGHAEWSPYTSGGQQQEAIDQEQPTQAFRLGLLHGEARPRGR